MVLTNLNHQCPFCFLSYPLWVQDVTKWGKSFKITTWAKPPQSGWLEMNRGSVVRHQLFSHSVPASRRTPFCCRRKIFKQLFCFLMFSDMLKLTHYHLYAMSLRNAWVHPRWFPSSQFVMGNRLPRREILWWSKLPRAQGTKWLVTSPGSKSQWA